MRAAIALMLLLLSSLVRAEPLFSIVNEARLPAEQIERMQREYAPWAERVYRYNQVSDPLPARLLITRRAGFGYYLRPTVYLPPAHEDEMLETWVHELAHHATGHDSSFFFKEGIAVNTLEKLFLEDGRIPQGFPQYGQSNDAWVNQFLLSDRMPPLGAAVAQKEYDGSSRDNDFRSWQIYIVAGAFVGWLIETHGYDRFREVFRNEKLGAPGAEWEARWLEHIRAQKLASFDAAEYLPRRERYRYYARQLQP